VSKIKIILISGKSHVGKGTVAQIIEEILKNQGKHVIHCSLSTYIRNLAKEDFYWDGIDTLESRKFMGEVYRIGTEFYPYHMMRRVWERDIQPYAKEDTIVIVESFREKVNYDYCKILLDGNKINNISTIRVVRPNFNAIQDEKMEHHVSESDLDDFKFDYIVENKGTVEELYSYLEEMFNDKTKVIS
jgi:molybdopterin-guanine dinucleotide biosynthesis protein